MTLEEESREKADVIRLIGEADLAAVPAIQGKFREKMKSGVDLLVVDFSRTTFVNTPVWALVVEYYQHTLKKKKQFALAGLDGRVLASFDIVRLGEFVDHFPTIDEAIDAKS